MKYFTKGEPSIGSLPYKVDLTDNIVTIPKRTPMAGDYVLYDKVNLELVCISSSADLSNYPSDNYTPIGIVVIPASHDVYGDGSCGIISLKTMSCTDPQNGSADNTNSENNRVGIYWGDISVDISTLSNFIFIAVGNTSNGTPTGQTLIAYLPSDKFNSIQCIHDTNVYYSDDADSDKQIPSPYLTDGSRNPGYYQTTSPSSTSNCLSDFDGVGNTAKIIAQRGTKDYNSWKPTYNSKPDYPAASCCDMFYTEGTSQGDWYLPAMGELGYIMPTFTKINEAIINIRDIYGLSVGVELNSIKYHIHYSSTEHSTGYVLAMLAANGLVSYPGKGYTYSVRAFLRAGGTSKISLKVI